jgi:hypothetical protein
MHDYQRQFFKNNYEWMKNQAIEKRTTDPYWYHVNLILRQMIGLINGYNHFQQDKTKNIDLEEFQAMNASGDIGELKYLKKDLDLH